MSEFCKKYNLTEEQFKKLIRDGKISTTIYRHDQIYTSFKNTLCNSAGVDDAVLKVSIKENVDVRTVYRIIAEFR